MFTQQFVIQILKHKSGSSRRKTKSRGAIKLFYLFDTYTILLIFQIESRRDYLEHKFAIDDEKTVEFYEEISSSQKSF